MHVRSKEETRKLMQVAQGERPADVAVVNARLVNVYTGEIWEGCSVCCSGRWIGSVGEGTEGRIGSATRVVDAGGRTLIPGLIDGHAHLAWLFTPDAFLACIAPHGTTTIVTELMEPYPVAGIQGVLAFLAALRDRPITFFATAPANGSVSRSVAGISEEDLLCLLEMPEVLGLGETYWQLVLQQPELYLPPMLETLRRGKVLEGHTAGAPGKRLMAYACVGVGSCHEPIRPQEVIDRLRLGLHVMIREGSIRRELEAMAPLAKEKIDLRRCILVTDGVVPGDLLRLGYMDYVVQKAIDLEFPPVEAIRMATLNVAEHFRIDHLVGGIAPGRQADLVLLPDERTIKPDLVIAQGQIIFENGRSLLRAGRYRFEDAHRKSICLPGEMFAGDFRIPAVGEEGYVGVRVIRMVTDLVTREEVLRLPVVGGEVAADPREDLVKVCAMDRRSYSGKRFVGLLKGFGLRSGAMACSAAWDTSDILVAGADEADMAQAVNRIAELQGGAVVCRGGEVIEELALPIFGLLSELPLASLAERLEALRTAAAGLGVPFPDPLLSLITLSGAAIPFLRICEEGLVHFKDGRTVGLFTE